MNGPRISFYVLGGLLVFSACNRTAQQASQPTPISSETAETKRAESAGGDVAVNLAPSESASSESVSSEVDLANTGPNPGSNPDSASNTDFDSDADDPDLATSGQAQSAEVEEGSPESVEPTVAQPERFIVLAEVGPIVVDLYLYMGNETYRHKVDVLIDDVLELGDENSDGQTTWKEITSSNHFVYGQYGNPQVDSEQQRVELVKTYDINRNKYVDRDEVLGFLRQDASNSQLFYLNESTTEAESVTASPVFQWLDINSDGVLDKSERESAPIRIWKNDTEDDRIIRANDFESSANNRMVANRRRNRRLPRKTLVPKDYSDWSKLLYALEEKYAYGNPLTVHDLPDFRSFFTLLDGDQDEYLSPREFSEVMHIAPHLSVTISFGDDSKQPITVEHIRPDLPLDSVSVNGNRFQITIADSMIELVAVEPTAATVIDQQIAGIFERSDSDDNGFISEEEFDSLGEFVPVPFAAVDSNEDQSIDTEELRIAISNRQLAQSSQIAGSVGANRQPLFRQLDVNGDGQLTAREVEKMPQRLKLLDENADGVISDSERPNAVSITLTRGGAANQFNPPPSEVSPPTNNESGPAWFRSMDVNNDGEISPREFLGPIETFDDFDADGDQTISLAEAVRA